MPSFSRTDDSVDALMDESLKLDEAPHATIVREMEAWRETKPRIGDTWYVVPAAWYEQWKTKPHAPAMDLQALCAPNGTLRELAPEEYVLVPTPVWDFLSSRYRIVGTSLGCPVVPGSDGPVVQLVGKTVELALCTPYAPLVDAFEPFVRHGTLPTAQNVFNYAQRFDVGETIARDTERDNFKSAEAAREYGLVDQVRADVGEYAAADAAFAALQTRVPEVLREALNAGGRAITLREGHVTVLYPDDTTESGKELRLKQEYFLTSAALQDILARYHRMTGKAVLWLPGTDHAGIATEMVVARNLGREGLTRDGLGREGFIEKVWEWKHQSGETMERQMRRLGASGDWSRSVFTLDPMAAQAVIESFVRMHEQGLIYRGKRLVNWDPVLKTAISDLEVENVEEDGFLWSIRYPLADGVTYEHVEHDADGVETLRETRDYLVVATTRPETMLGDTAVMVHPDDARYATLHAAPDGRSAAARGRP